MGSLLRDWAFAFVLMLMFVVLATPIAAAQTTPGNGTMVPVVSPATGSQAASAKLPLADRFKTVAAANTHCPGSSVVWSTLSKSKSFHVSGSRFYGTTKHGSYVCKSDALAFGFHQARS